MKTTCSSETSVDFQRRYIPEDGIFQMIQEASKSIFEK
jgi:hypothetical protein